MRNIGVNNVAHYFLRIRRKIDTMKNIKQVFYKGHPYDYKMVPASNGERRFLIYEGGMLMRFVHEEELDKRWPLLIRMDNLFEKVKMGILTW